MSKPDWLLDLRPVGRLWYRAGVDARTGRAVRVSIPDQPNANDPTPREPSREEWRRGIWPLFYDRRAEIRRRQAAETATKLRSPAFVRVLATEPEVIVEEPRKDVAVLDAEDAIECLLELCEALAELHARGWAHRRLLPGQVGIALRDGRPHVELAFPAIGAVHLADDDAASARVGAIGGDLLQAARLAAIWSGREPDEEVSPSLADAVRDVESAATLARVLATRARDARGWRERIERMPDVTALTPVPTDWDRVIRTLEDDLAALAGQPHADIHAPYFSFQLASALDQRARLSLARHDLESAQRDVDRALELDDDGPYRVTRAVVRLELGDDEGALADADAALSPPRARAELGTIGELTLFDVGPPGTELEGALRARAHLVRARVSQRRGDHASARREIELARASSDEPVVDAIARASRA